MPATVEIVRLDPTQFREAAEVLTRAYLDDPFTTFCLPTLAERQTATPALMEWACQFCQVFGESYATSEPIQGVAFWLPPNSGETTAERLELTGFSLVAEAFGAEGLGRYGAVMGHLAELHPRYMPTAHWYLLGIGVDPPHQGRGIGGHLLQPALRKADVAGLPCYLETQKERNVPFYRRLGFEVVGETDSPAGGPHFWLMARPPRSEASKS